MNPILSITEKAANQIKKLVSNAPEGINALLIGVDKSGCSGYAYKMDFVKVSEVEKFDLVERDGVKIYIDPKATMFLMGSEMDYQTDKLSSRFVFNNPNQKSTCGCGESFSI